VLVTRILTFALGGAVAVALYRLKVSPFWSFIAGIVVYVVVDLIVEHVLFGQIG